MIRWIKQKPLIHVPIVIFGIILLLIVLAGGFIAYSLKVGEDTAPGPSFSFDEPNAVYKIEKREEDYWITYQNLDREDNVFKASLGNTEVRVDKYGDAHSVGIGQKFEDSKGTSVAMFIGNSQVDLEPFLGKSLKIKGSFRRTFTNEQCIINNCHKLSPYPEFRAAVVDIEAVEVK